MISFPKSTFVGKFLAKEQFYKRDVLDGALKQALVDDIAKITLEYNFSERSLKVEKGTVFEEINVIKLVLKHRDFNEKLLLNAIDKAISSSYVLFLLEFEDEQALSIAFKENTSTITRRWNTEWSNSLELAIDGSTIDQIYRNFIEQISGGKVIGNNTEQIKESIATDIEKEKIQKQIEKLEAKLHSETQLNKQIEIKHQIAVLKEKLNG